MKPLKAIFEAYKSFTNKHLNLTLLFTWFRNKYLSSSMIWTLTGPRWGLSLISDKYITPRSGTADILFKVP